VRRGRKAAGLEIDGRAAEGNIFGGSAFCFLIVKKGGNSERKSCGGYPDKSENYKEKERKIRTKIMSMIFFEKWI
jgi:hypothetical protein